MLINLSNHPSDNWSNEQKLKAIEQYQKIVDIPFPEVDPNGDEEYIENLAGQYLNKILEIKNRTFETVVVHLMGELTFSFALLVKLKAYGVRCVASTTQRVVMDEGNGRVTKLFRFVRFRKYI